jgi:seryl-tRNA synthetase
VLDINVIRDQTELVRRAVADKQDDADIDRILALDERRRQIIPERDQLKQRQNQVGPEISRKKKAGEDASALIEEMAQVKEKMKALDEEERTVTAERDALMLYVPNVPLEDVPPGGGPEDNPLVREADEKPGFDFSPREHWELGESLGILDIPRGAKLSGSGWSMLKGLGARMQHALIQFMLDTHTREHGYTEVFPPFVCNRRTVQNTGQLPKFEVSDMYRIESDDLFLVTTAEVPLTSIHADELLGEDDLPIRYTGYTACFRRESGAAGKETRGLARLHQFEKVELFQIVKPDEALQALEQLTQHAETVLKRLGLHYRVIQLCRGDLGFSSAKTYDLEVWAPGRNEGRGEYLEVSSCSVFTDFQSRRANIRYRPTEGKKPVFPYTLNGSGVALPRLLIALWETYQQEDGSVVIPEVLRPYMGGIERIPVAQKA